MDNANQLKNELRNFYGSENWYRHWLNNMTYTDGARFFAENAGGGAHWFLDIVATELMRYRQKEEFIHIVLKSEGGRAVIDSDDGNGRIFHSKRIDYTDCPEGAWEFYLTNGVLMLPSEY